MLTCYITEAEFIRTCDVSRFGEDVPGRLGSALATATGRVATYLRRRGYESSLLYIPRMFDGIAYGATTTRTTSGASDAIQALGETRFVVDYRSEGAATFSLMGSTDGTNWKPVHDTTGQEVILTVTGTGHHTVTWSEQFSYYRYVIETGESVTFAAFLVDTSADAAIIYTAAQIILLPYIGDSGTVTALYAECKALAESEIQNFAGAYDYDNSGTIEDGEQSYSQRVYQWR